MPIHVSRPLHDKEKVYSPSFAHTICQHAVSSSYRDATKTINHDYHRSNSQALLTHDTVRRCVIGEGRELDDYKKRLTTEILLKNGFPETGVWPKELELPEYLRNKPLSAIDIDPAKIMVPTYTHEWPPALPMSVTPENETCESETFSQPDTSIYPPNSGRRGSRNLISDENREAVLTDYATWINTRPDRNPSNQFLHFCSFERYIASNLYISIDAIMLDKQAEKHVNGGKRAGKDSNDRIKHWNIVVQRGESGERYRITALTIEEAFRELIAFLLANNLHTRHFIFFIDGETAIFKAIDLYFEHWYHTTYLDFFHVQEKVYNLLSLAMVGTRVPDPWYREGIISGPGKSENTSISRLYGRRLVNILWWGNIEEAKYYLEHIDPKLIKNKSALNSLLTYISKDGKGKYITCYAMRKKAGLINSSNSVENENEVIVGDRQKMDDRMFWREQGSGTLASITCLYANHEDEDWFFNREFSFVKPEWLKQTA